MKKKHEPKKPTVRRGTLCVLDGQAFAKVKAIDGAWITFEYMAGVEPEHIGTTAHDTLDGNVIVLKARKLEHAVYEYAQIEKRYDDANFIKNSTLRSATHNETVVLADIINELEALKDRAELINDVGNYYAMKEIRARLERGRQRLLDGLAGKAVDNG